MAKKDTPDVDGGGNAAPVAAAMLKAFIERIERLNSEKDDITSDTKEVYAEAKSNGLDSKIIRKIVARRKRDAQEVAQEEMLIDTYEHALGMHPDE